MTEKEIELAMEGLFRGAAKVRARKYSKKLSSNVNRKLIARIAEQSWKDEKDFLKAAWLEISTINFFDFLWLINGFISIQKEE